MRKLLNTLYVTTPDSFLSKEGDNVVVMVKGTEKFRIPIYNIEGIVSFGYTGASPALMKMCADKNIGLCFLTEHGEFLGRVSGPIKGNVLLRRQQYRIADEKEASLNLSRIFIAGKIANCRNVVQRSIRDHGDELNILDAASKNLLLKSRQSFNAIDSNQLRGIEGEAATSYFGVFNQLIKNSDSSFYFGGRTRRPPKDNVNALLSFIYMLLAHEVQSALESVGLDPYVGFLHTDRPGRASLALDIMEEFRPYLADRLVLSLINRRQVSGKGFVQQGEKGIIMTDETKKEILLTWQKRKKESIQHPFLGETVNIGLLPYIQAMLLARYIRGDIDNYPVFVMK
ncbi:CRISP-associated protein Cas1 [Bacteroides luti]|uniref:CRISPR-associated endonuclease Cas1 n=1 Tax=Bacteroides luti TaxID=1297750 RepID=A0A1M5DNX8_9BACE|nr:type I-C CRISPR-associated endonuclease Cas1c [Bacteroides luti]SHF68482.1 CRISP-associated protein Cas1 [Bacteroides luti]